MYSRALVQRWPISPEQRREIVTRLMEVVRDSGASNRELVAACRGLLAAEAQNQTDEHRAAVSNDDRNRFKEIAERLGIGNSLN